MSCSHKKNSKTLDRLDIQNIHDSLSIPFHYWQFVSSLMNRYRAAIYRPGTRLCSACLYCHFPKHTYFSFWPYLLCICIKSSYNILYAVHVFTSIGLIMRFYFLTNNHARIFFFSFLICFNIKCIFNYECHLFFRLHAKTGQDECFNLSHGKKTALLEEYWHFIGIVFLLSINTLVEYCLASSNFYFNLL